jgi:S-adenosylmethionine:diacylglycerol 3-amino-3-carboxypropyl transferase
LIFFPLFEERNLRNDMLDLRQLSDDEVALLTFALEEFQYMESHLTEEEGLAEVYKEQVDKLAQAFLSDYNRRRLNAAVYEK